MQGTKREIKESWSEKVAGLMKKVLFLNTNDKRRRKTPMQNYEEPFHFTAYRYENDEMARISGIAVGS